ncbi:nitroreductase/quinone reductase family protein [Streptomonospora nanhaiensis]|uniref:Deazaflavin-dependent oxidoreductase (Nitroreductase family) n=1 Tax=Streptomonospora nanhaiensis TaxID=1323731 RepID=A0A853BN20_9ACTN|nr:nitroreductase/quinone reductase family protein [Streptomonospora nanhaiensis]MBV2362050.1 nitroreductase family deazaflavin-dependent oxidoreductase [Streptomonospora nanhaiensis]MBX9391317.1 nitroreductase/quinone reductase family protein [Streptomonospora nanhaiensis]NYI96124.1 deazaflavin-dependent oxidoreductase (nitroreductase family) [Streptomonospora nanhaiensis]
MTETSAPVDFNQAVIDEFRANRGRVGGMFEGARLLLLTTTGARSGRPHTVPLGYLPDGDRSIVIASAGGSPRHPAWFHNLRANPRVTVENGVFVLEADAVVLEGEERDAVFARAVESDPGWGEYQAKAGRTIPVVALTPVTAAPVETRLGEGLVALHDSLRRELALIRAEVGAAGPRLGAQLRINCLTMCQSLGFHHTMEDNGMFPAVAKAHPETAETIARLSAEHKAIERLLERLQDLLGGAEPTTGALAEEVDRLITELEAHLDYEEEQLVPILNSFAP